MKVLKTTSDAMAATQPVHHSRVVCHSSDGEKRRGKALIALTFTVILSILSPIFQFLGHLVFMCLWVGDDDVTADKDYKHVFKRLRNTVLRSKGLFVRGIHLTPAVIKAHLRDAGHTDRHIHSMFKPEDKKDVMLAYTLLRDLWSLPSASPSFSSRPGYAETREAIKIYGDLCFHLVLPYICVELTLSEQLEHLSSAAHLALALYDPGDRLMPTVLYIDIMIMIKNVYFCVAKAKADHPLDPFYIILLGTDRLETLFGILRTMVGNDANLDALQLSLRVTGTTDVANIFALHPEWDKTPRRLHLPSVTKDMKSVPDAADHANPAAWIGDVIPFIVSLITCWKRGRRAIEARYPWTVDILRHIETIPNATILAPHGVMLFNLPLSSDDDEDDEDEGLTDPTTVAPDSAPEEDITDGLRDLEDAATEIDLDRTPGQQSFTRFINVNGAEVNKARALSQRFKYQKSAASTDRLRRVMSKGRYQKEVEIEELDAEGERLSVNDPVASLLDCEGKLWLSLSEVKSILIHSRPVDSVPASLLPEKAVSVSYQVMRLIRATVDDDPSKKNDWRSSLFLSPTFKVPGSLIQPINPAISTRTPGRPCFIFDSSSLMALTASLHDQLTQVQSRNVPHITRTHEYPYREQTGTCSTQIHSTAVLIILR